MNGAESLVETLSAGGVEVCFTNPGTSEMHLVAASTGKRKSGACLDCLKESSRRRRTATREWPENPLALCSILGPGSRAIANFHNAWRARTPMINLIGQHALFHLAKDTPLNSDIEGIARPYSNWLRTSRSVSEVGRDAAESLVASRTPPGQIATLIVPADVAWDPGGKSWDSGCPCRGAAAARSDRTSGEDVELRIAYSDFAIRKCAWGRGREAAGRVAAATNARLLVPYPFPRLERGAGRPIVDRIPYVPQQAIELRRNLSTDLVGTGEPLAFASPKRNAELVPTDCEIHQLSQPGEDCAGALEAILSTGEFKKSRELVQPAKLPPLPTGEITLDGLAAAIAACLPENAIVVDESMTAGRGIMAAARGAAPHD